MINSFMKFVKRQRIVIFSMAICIILFQIFHYGYLESMDPIVEKSLSFWDELWLFFNGAKYFEIGDTYFVKELPYIWIVFHSLWFYIIYKEFNLDEYGTSIQILIREKSRQKWWKKKWREVQINNIILFFVFIVILQGSNFYNFKNEGELLFNELYLNSHLMTIPENLNFKILFLRLILLPLLCIITMTSVLSTIELVINKNMISYISSFIIMFASLFFDIPILFMNYSMSIRNMNYSKFLVNDALGIVVLIVLNITMYIFGIVYVRKLDVL